MDNYPVPNINDFTHMLSGARIFNVIDCKRAYHQIPVSPQDIPKTAIITPMGLFEYHFMPFGLKNAAQTWQRFIDSILRQFEFCFAYLDDIIVFSRSVEEHESHLSTVLQTLHANGVEVNQEKFQLHQPSVSFLGYTVSADGIQPPVSRVQAITSLSPPVT